MNTTKNNKLFAEFMAKLGDWRAKNLLRGGFGVKCLSHYGNYHDSWDWIMPVVKKIHDIHSNKMIPDPDGLESFAIYFKLCEALNSCNIKEVCAQCAEYIGSIR